jgi:Family of unknown function (DUF6641)
MLDSLKLTEKTPYAAFSTPEAHLRRKFLSALDTQIAAAEAHSENKPFLRRGKRWLPDQQTGERVLKEVPLRFLPWWWRDEAGKLMLTLRYGSKRIELKPGKPAIEVGEEQHLLPTLKLIREAVAAGELDKLLVTAKQQRRRR